MTETTTAPTTGGGTFGSARFLRLVRRNLSVWRKRSSHTVVADLFDPLIALIGLGYGLGTVAPYIGGTTYLKFLGSGMLCSVVMNKATFEALYPALTRLKFHRTWESILQAPMGVHDIVIGEWVWAGMKGVISGVVILIGLTALGAIESWSALWVLPVLALTGLAFSGAGLIVTALADSYDSFTLYWSLLVWPMMFVSGVFFPREALAEPLQLIGLLFPLAHAIELSRGIVLGAPVENPFLHSSILIAYSFVPVLIAGKLLKTRLTK